MTASLFPLFADLRDRSVLVVGGGAVAERKVEALLRAGAHALVGAPQLSPILQQWAAHGRIRWLCGEFVERWLDDEPVWLVVATTDDRRVNRAVAAAGQARRLLVNVVDDAELSSFQVPAVVDRGPLQIAISSGGGAPMVARHLRKQLETSLDEAWGALTALFARNRAAICEHFPDIAERRRFFDAQLAGPLLRLLRQRQPQQAEAYLQQALQRRQAEPASGSVVLVGAGPGDPGLLTLNALRALNEADVILHDRLVSDAVLQLARRDAQRIEVGKSAQGHSTRQEHIHELMLQHARAGRRVVRLKGGDPFVFGRGGEELEFLRDHDIAFEVVPGITAALACAAYAAIPLTHREHAQSLRLVTAHCKDSLDTLDWQALGQERQTLAFYMAVAGLEPIQQRLLQAGRAADTPFALIENGSRPQQRVVTGVLADLHGAAQRHAVCSPALLVVGEVAALAGRLHWFGEPPLADAVATGSPHCVTSATPKMAHAA